ncbi:prepilin peptidase [Paenibacillus sp. WLX2291]|uniref:prepilin peptidase n=1 Tax=Paenibacillus sp. WLX2291 TaxID=3296934 RepID=UPI003984615E
MDLLNHILLETLALLCLYFAYTDIRYQVISNQWTHPMMGILLLWRLVTMEWMYLYGLIPALILLLIFMILPSVIGAGDIKLLGIIGLVGGLPIVLSTIFTMGLLCMVYVGIRLVRRQTLRHQFPLAPMIAAGLWFAIVLI